jgi:methylmalonyl-CoA/ethylmalonyl-CoA epimerase
MNKSLALHLHHVGYATKRIDFLAEVYVSRYGYILATPVIHDPLQGAFVQFLNLAGDRTYLEFVAPDGPESKLSHASKRGGLNHLCYTTGPLDDAIAQLEASGAQLISELTPGVAFGGRRVCWMVGEDPLPIELIERRDDDDLCLPGVAHEG